ncbi:MAG: DUF748 domain-containing protein [Xanthomonadales bacterium]|nr:DUF748 domain-containing protein [Xanthomonadales bacterium]
MDSTSRLSSALKHDWLNPRRKRFWALVALLVYTLIGFFLIPVLVESSLTGFVRDNLQREATVNKVEVNPYSLSLNVQGFEIRDRDDAVILRFDEFFANFQLSSLFRRAWTFREIRLDRPWFLYERFASGDSRLGRLLEDFAKPAAETEAANGQDEGLPRLLVQAFFLNGGAGQIRDAVPEHPFEVEVGPITLALQELNSLPDRYGRKTLQVELPDGAALTWVGKMSLTPFHSQGSVSLQDSRLHSTISYLEALLPLDAISAELDLRFDYSLRVDEAGTFAVEVDDLLAQLQQLQVSGLEPGTRFLEIPLLQLEGGSLRYPEQRLHFERIGIEQPRVIAWLDENRALSLAQLAPAAEPAESRDAANGAALPWTIGIRAIELRDGEVELSDRGIEPPTFLSLRAVSLQADDFSNEAGTDFPLNIAATLPGESRLALDGRLALFPDIDLSATVTSSGILLSLAEPYAQQAARISVAGGRLHGKWQLEVDDAALVSVTGPFSVDELDLRDSIEEEGLLGWRRLEVEDLALRPGDKRLEISAMTLHEPSGRIVIFADKTTNLSRLAREAAKDMESETEPEQALQPGQQTQESDPGQAEQTEQNDPGPLDIVIGGVQMQQGSLDFSDLSLPLPFRATITGLGGTLSTVSTVSGEPAEVQLEGQVEEFGLARIEGYLAPFDPLRNTDIRVDFRNLEMSSFSPYSVQFAGREIAAGKLNLDLGYMIANGRLVGRNDIVLSDLVLGDKVDHPDAASLPLGLAVALLKDSNGVIDVELPVEGDVNDPQFEIGGLIWKAISGLIGKVVSAPFRLLANLLGVETDDLGQIRFLPGRSDLTPPEREKVAQLHKALQQRPELTLEIPAVYAVEIDGPALRYELLRDQVLERAEKEQSPEELGNFRFDVSLRPVLESLFSERFADTPLADIQAAHRAPPADDPEGEAVLDELAYTHDLRDRLLADLPVAAADLEQLGAARAETVRAAFLAAGDLNANRLLTTGLQEGERENDEWVLMELNVAAE